MQGRYDAIDKETVTPTDRQVSTAAALTAGNREWDQ